MRGAAAYLWWTYYRALKKREGVIGAPANANAVSGTIFVAAPSAAKTKTRAAKTPGSEPRN
jgi:DNA-3-methyladenine glycosylase II